MFLLYRASTHHFHMSMKSQAAAMGAEVDWDDDWYEPKKPEDNTLRGSEIPYLPIGLGYEG